MLLIKKQTDRNISKQQVRQIERKLKKLLNKNEINSDEILIFQIERQKNRQIDLEIWKFRMDRQKHFIIASQIDRKKEKAL